ncbi:MAG: GNAT family N-acetyltransferase [Clostridia bacterium]|jgi:RimJ/RimL family protein N-acetyltransferase|nr:GNAT family N-acetyltransferase [Clostridia bacterium]NLV34951.1 GNAT family N-acetyltransferase [Clostridiaceae bacterium]OQB52342.1 MAG: Acetyltransferase (GNAT) family protein [Firmicutes bacterium ADurb.Bin146]MDD4501856.1 GNAT family N-acetyltransferase [Clostridia bacterium]HQM95678.1 GNAT family N-acetyltransferase [Clostridia bacterium]
MERAASVFLHADIDTSKAAYLLDWVRDPVVTRYLNEKSDVAEKLNHIITTVHPSLLTCHLNKSGRFYFVCRQNNEAIGFVRLADTDTPKEYELVIVIGRKEIWGKGYGTKAVRECLRTAFFEWRAERVTAYVHFDNVGCAKALRKAGMKHISQTENCDFFDITFDEFISYFSKKDKSVNS